MKTFKEFIFEEGEALGAAGGVTNSVSGIAGLKDPGVLPKDQAKSRKIKSPILTVNPLTRKL